MRSRLKIRFLLIYFPMKKNQLISSALLCCAVLSIRAPGISDECYYFSSIESTGLEDGSCYFSYSSTFLSFILIDDFDHYWFFFYSNVAIERIVFSFFSFLNCSLSVSNRFFSHDHLLFRYPWSLYYDRQSSRNAQIGTIWGSIFPLSSIL